MKYVPLYIKTHNTLLSSTIKISDLVIKAKEYRFDALTITDDNMYGCLDFYKECKKNNIKPIIGLEILLEQLPFVLYVKNYEGYQNLIKLETLKSEKKLDILDLTKYNSELICIVPYTSIKLYDKLKQIYKEIFIGYKTLDERSKLTGNNLIYFNEVLYLEKKDEILLKYICAIKEGKTIQNTILDKKNNYLLSYDEFIKNYEIDKQNNEYIYENCNLDIKEKQDLIPKFKCPNNLDAFSYLKELCKEGLKRIFGEKVNKIYIDRLKYELEIINKMGFCNYFLIVWDYVKYAKENGILVGPGRGSAAGSLVSYVLNITTIDPIKYNLLFERFLNPERVTMPDIDIDFEYMRRDEVIRYCTEKYGLTHVASIITFGTLGCKQAIRDVGKVLSINLATIDIICKKLDSNLTLTENLKVNPKLKEIINMKQSTKDLYVIANKLEGIKRHTSIHAAGVVMSNIPLAEVIPLEKNNDIYTTGYSMTYLEDLGLLKMDFLVLKNLSIIKDCLNDINDNLTFDNIPLGDESAFRIFSDVNTLGIFQFETEGLMNVLRKFKPTNLIDLASILALFRPGPMNNIDTYIKRKIGKEKPNYFHEDLVSILKPTYGVIVYQEQIMQIVSVMAGYSYGEADVLRRAMSKKNETVMLEKRDDFITKSINRGYSKQISEEVYDLILKFAEYGFNKAHSVSYAMISYRMAYLKAHYPLIFFKNLFNSSIGSEEKIKMYFYECKKNNIPIVFPSINNDNMNFEVKNAKIYVPISIIKGVGVGVINKINETKPFKDIFDFVIKVYGNTVNKKVLENLIDGGVLDCFNLNRKTLNENLDLIINYVDIGGLINDDSLKPELVFKEDYSKQELMKREREVYGFYMSDHPASRLKLKYKDIVDIDVISSYFDKIVEIIICVDRIKETVTKDLSKMMFINGYDETGKIGCVVFPKLYSKISDIAVDDVVYVKGKVEKRYDNYQIIAYEIKKLEMNNV